MGEARDLVNGWGSSVGGTGDWVGVAGVSGSVGVAGSM